jgi:hypothetical protein
MLALATDAQGLAPTSSVLASARERALEQQLSARALWRAAMRGACIALISI